MEEKKFDKGLYKGAKVTVKVLNTIIFAGLSLLAILIIGASLL